MAISLWGFLPPLLRHLLLSPSYSCLTRVFIIKKEHLINGCSIKSSMTEEEMSFLGHSLQALVDNKRTETPKRQPLRCFPDIFFNIPCDRIISKRTIEKNAGGYLARRNKRYVFRTELMLLSEDREE